MKIKRGLILLLFCTQSSVFADPLINAWTNPASGNWEDLKWSLGVRPGSGQSIMLTNQGWKAVAIGPNTVQNFSDTLDVSSVTLGGYTDSFNLLLLNYAGFETPLVAGSVNVGTNSGITALASVLTVSSNSGSGDLSIFSAFNQGEDAIVNAHVINLGNYLSLADGPGTYNQTNGIINADVVEVDAGSTFNQFDGANTIGTLWMGAANSTSNYGRYNLGNGSLTAGSIEMYRGDFNQTGGSVFADLHLGGNYTLSDGTLRLPGINIPYVVCGPRNPCPNSIGVNATLRQTGGTNFCAGPLAVFNMRGAPGVGAPYYGPGHYVLSGGVLYVSGTVSSGSPYYDGGGDFQQWAGWHTNAGTHVVGQDMSLLGGLRLSSFTLGGGTMITPSVSISLGTFTQSGGTNQVSGDVRVGNGPGLTTNNLTGGLLTDLNTTVDGSSTAGFGDQHAVFIQTGGTHIITNLLLLSGPPPPYGPPPGGGHDRYLSATYVLAGGVLNAPNIRIVTNAFFEHNGGTLTTSGLLTLGWGVWDENTTGQQFGQLLLSAPAGSNATFSLPPSGNCVVRFANSSSVAWSNQAGLLIANWKGSPMGGGNDQVFFGSSSAGLTGQQLSQIQFFNPAGANGTFPARILSTGEIVPDRFLAVRENSSNLTIEWSGGTLQSSTNVTGPYQDVSGATSPYTAPFTGPQRFFRIRE